MKKLKSISKFVIITSYYHGEKYGLLGPQTAATVIRENSPIDCIVVGVDRRDDKRKLTAAVFDFFGREKPVIGFSALSGRPDLFAYAGELKAKGAVTILAGPQAAVDFKGEVGAEDHSHRFAGYADCFSMALQGPAEQLLGWLNDADRVEVESVPGMLYEAPGVFSESTASGRAADPHEKCILQNVASQWNHRYMSSVDWTCLYRFDAEDGLVRHRIETAQVLQQIGCPHATRRRSIEIDPPSALQEKNVSPVTISMCGCSFCDVAADKGYYGALPEEAVMAQLEGLPSGKDGRKIAFELVNETPLPGLTSLMRAAIREGIDLSRIDLTLRADGLAAGADHLKEALAIAKERKMRILLSSIGFESFSACILKNLNKGLSVETNLAAVRTARRLKAEFLGQLGYLRSEGGNHGLIHPTPWDTPQTDADNRRVAAMYSLPADILPSHSTPLIIHHASALADWIRRLEKDLGLEYPRHGNIIAWWNPPE